MTMLDKIFNKKNPPSAGKKQPARPHTAKNKSKAETGKRKAEAASSKQPARPKVSIITPQNKTASTSDNKKVQAASVLDKDRNLVADTIWMFVLVLTIYLGLSLLGFSMKDPSWSRSIANTGYVSNFGGLLGAWISDVFYYLFGLSAWWLLIALCVWLYRHFRPVLDGGMPPYNSWIGAVGLGILLMCSPVMEVSIFLNWLDDRLPLGAGGLVGSLVASGTQYMLGKTGSMVFLLIGSLLALSLLIQISWLDFVERVGNQLERFFKQLFSDKDKEVVPTLFPDAPAGQRAPNPIETLVAEPITQPIGSRTNRKMSVSVAQQQPKILRPNRVQAASVDGYCLPDLDNLREPKSTQQTENPEHLRQVGKRIEEKLAEFGIEVTVVSGMAGPVITRYEIEPAKGVKGSQIVALSKDLARSLSVQSVRVVETIVGKNTMGIELPNEHRQEVLLHEIFASDVFNDAQSKLTVALGKDIAGLPVVGDLAKMPHLLVGGMTGSGKSVGVNAMILSMLYKASPDEVRFIMIDPKMLELSVYEGIPHLLCPVVTDMKAAGNALNWCVAEMEKRYRLLSHMGVRTLASFNEKVQAAKLAEKAIPNPFSLNSDDPEPLEKLPQIVVIIDELADLMMTEKKAVETQIARLAQKARAAGIHMIIATQRPSVDVITGLIKANVPTRMAFTVQSRIDSRTILDQMGAEDLLKYGDLLFLQPGEAEPTRLQGAFVSDDEVHNVVSFIKEQAEPNYIDGILTGEATQETQQFINPEGGQNSGDELFDQAVQFVVSSRKTSISALQRHLRIGYNRAANLMQALEDGGIVSPPDSSGARQIFARGE